MSLESAIEALTQAIIRNMEAQVKLAVAYSAVTAHEQTPDDGAEAKKPAAKKPAAKKPAAKKPAAKKPAAKKPAEVELRPDIDINGLRKLAGAYMATEDPDARELAKSNVRAAFDHLGAKVLTDLSEQTQMTSLAAYIDTWVANDGAQIDFDAIDERVAAEIESEGEDSLLG